MPGHPAARHLAQQLFRLGYHCTSGFRCSGTYHGCGPVRAGAATDWGNSANSLSRQWYVLYPHRAKLIELLGPWGLYKHGRRFYHNRLQSQHRDHNHVANTQYVWLVAAKPKPVALTQEEREVIHDLTVWRNRERRRIGSSAERRHRRWLMRKAKYKIRLLRKEILKAVRTDGGWNKNDRRRRYNVLGAVYHNN